MLKGGYSSHTRQLEKRWHETAAGKFDSNMVGERMFEHPLELVLTPDIPSEHAQTRPLGRHLGGCRIPPVIAAKSQSSKRGARKPRELAGTDACATGVRSTRLKPTGDAGCSAA